MKQLKDKILEKLCHQQVDEKLCHQQVDEKLIINKDSKLANNMLLNISGKTLFNEQNIIQINQFANKFKQKPIAITNEYVVYTSGVTEFSNDYIFLYFYENYNKIALIKQFLNTKNDAPSLLAIKIFTDDELYKCSILIGGNIGWQDTPRYYSLSRALEGALDIIKKHKLQ